jgi:hypothetical protein
VETVAVYASRQQVTRNAIGCGVFVLIGVLMMVDGNLLLGLVCAIVFGLGLLACVPRLLQSKPVFELTPAGLRPQSGGVVPWQDVEDVAVGLMPRIGGVVGVRLSDYTAYVGSTPGRMPVAKLLDIWIAARLMPRSARPDISGLTRRQRNHVALLAWNRKRSGGLDLSWSSRMFEESPESLVSQILAYRTNVLNV